MAELWDIYDINRNKTGKFCERDMQPLKECEFHLVVHGWILNNEGEILLCQRASDRKFPLMWEGIGGSVLAGETSIQGMIREIEEEIGLIVDEKNAILLHTETRPKFHDIYDVWLFKTNIAIDDLKFNDGETINAKWVTKEEFDNMLEANEIVYTLTYFKAMYYEV